MPPTPLRPPFKLIEHEEAFEVQDAGKRHLAYIYFEDESSRQSSMNRISKAEAKALAGIFMRALIAEARLKVAGRVGEGGEAFFPEPGPDNK